METSLSDVLSADQGQVSKEAWLDDLDEDLPPVTFGASNTSKVFVNSVQDDSDEDLPSVHFGVANTSNTYKSGGETSKMFVATDHSSTGTQHSSWNMLTKKTLYCGMQQADGKSVILDEVKNSPSVQTGGLYQSDSFPKSDCERGEGVSKSDAADSESKELHEDHLSDKKSVGRCLSSSASGSEHTNPTNSFPEDVQNMQDSGDSVMKRQETTSISKSVDITFNLDDSNIGLNQLQNLEEIKDSSKDTEIQDATETLKNVTEFDDSVTETKMLTKCTEGLKVVVHVEESVSETVVQSNSLFDSLIHSSSVISSDVCMNISSSNDKTVLETNVELFNYSSDTKCSKLPTSIMADDYKRDSPPLSKTKQDISSEDEETYFDVFSAKSGGESSSSKDERGSQPSCSGTPRASLGVLLCSDSDEEHPSANWTLPIKKRKMDSQVEIICDDSSSGDETKSDIDYSNLTPEQIKALIEDAKRYGKVRKKCKCPKTKWEDLPIVGPIKPSGKCTIGKGDWSESQSEPCPNCVSGNCTLPHQHGRRGRRRGVKTATTVRPRTRGTIGQDVPIIELSDSEEVSLVPQNVAAEVTIPAVQGECIVLSSSEDDDDIVCETVIKKEEKNQPSFQVAAQAPGPPTADTEMWPDIDFGNLDEAMLEAMLETIVRPTLVPLIPAITPTVPERPPTPEVWSCPICLESKSSVTEIMSTTCGHVFCGNCIRSSVRIHKKCPTCRKKLTMKQFHKIFL